VSLRSKLAERARPFLEPGEQIQAIFRAQSGPSPYWQIPFFVVFLIFTCITLPDALRWGNSTTALAMALAVGAVAAVLIVLVVLVRVHPVVATDRAIVVLDATKWTNRPTRLRLRHSRDFRFGPMSGTWGTFVLDNTKYWVPKQFHKDVAAADAALT
jgi:hypothetical protein